jgi:hypothetical protein
MENPGAGRPFGGDFGVWIVCRGLVFSPWLLTIRDVPTHADAIVVLGGDWVWRPKQAAELYHEGWASRIVVSGKGEAPYLRRELVKRGVPASAVLLEDQAMNTWQNAQYSVRLLGREKAGKVIIVTSWFHSRRAMQCFCHYASPIQFISVPTMTDRPKPGFDVFKGKRITPGRVRCLANAADACWRAILKRDLEAFRRHFRASFEAQVSLFPAMSDPKVRATLRGYSNSALGWKLSGAGGGGYLVLVTKSELPGAIKLKIRRTEH